MSLVSSRCILLNSAHLVNGTYNLTEWTDFAWADEITFQIDIQQTVGSPSAGTISAKFQNRVIHKTGTIQYNNQRLVDYSAAEKSARIVEGDFPATLADYSLAAPASFQRTVRNFGPGCNLVLTVAGISGGTSPYFQVTVTMIAKGVS